MHDSFTPRPGSSSYAEATPITRRKFLLGGTAAGVGLAAYAATHARHELEVVSRTVRIANLPDAFQGFRIAQLSDIHLEEYTETYFLERVVDRINALHADLLLFTGDFVSRGPRPFAFAREAAGRCAEVLSRLTCPQRYAVLGNHDAAVGAADVIAPIEAHGLPVLVDQFIPIERKGERFWLCGAQDPGTLGCDLNAAIPAKPDGPVILMAHEPDFVDAAVHHPRFPLIDLMLSGHSHGGQVRLPLLGPLILPPMGKKYVEGLFQIRQMQLYVNRGIGTVGLPFRLNCPPEITEITLQRA
jgi:predicted MPP superfamily phosphohydrolase